MTIVCDSREQRWEHVRSYFDREKIRWVRSKLFCGDYTLLNDQTVVIDRKQHLQEVAGNLCQQHERFRSECARAQENGIQIIVLIEHGSSIASISDVRGWINPRLKTSPNAITGARMMAKIEIEQAVEAAITLKQWCKEHPCCEGCEFCPCQNAEDPSVPETWWKTAVEGGKEDGRTPKG